MKFAAAVLLAVGVLATDTERSYVHKPSSYGSYGSSKKYTDTSRGYGHGHGHSYSHHGHGYSPATNVYGELYSKLHNLEARIDDLEANEIILDYFETNKNTIVIDNSGSIHLTERFCVLKGQSVDIQAQVSATVGDLDLQVVLNDSVVAHSSESEDRSTDHTSQSVIFRVTCKEDGEFYVRLNNGGGSNQTIGSHHMQVGVRIYEHGYLVEDHLPEECPDVVKVTHHDHGHYRKPTHKHYYTPSYSAYYKPHGHYAHH